MVCFVRQVSLSIKWETRFSIDTDQAAQKTFARLVEDEPRYGASSLEVEGFFRRCEEASLLAVIPEVKPSGPAPVESRATTAPVVDPATVRLLAPVCTKIGFNTELKLMPLLERVALAPEQLHRVNLMNGWRLVRCINP